MRVTEPTGARPPYDPGLSAPWLGLSAGTRDNAGHMRSKPLNPDLPPRLVLLDHLAIAMIEAADRGDALVLLFRDLGAPSQDSERRAPGQWRTGEAALVPLETLALDDALISLFRLSEPRFDPAPALLATLPDADPPARTSGLAVYPRHGSDPSSLLAAARLAARGARAGCIGVPDTERGLRQGDAATAPLARSLAADRLTLHYQPQIDIESGRVVALEALARVRGAAGDPLLPLHEDAGDGAGLDRVVLWALDRVAADQRVWAAEGLAPIRVSVNLPLAHGIDAGLVDRILTLVADSGLPAHSFGLELTETEAPVGLGEIGRQLERLRAAGIALSLDDFGVGYAAPFLLDHLSLDLLKLDKSLLAVDALAGDSLLRAAIALGRRHGMAVLAEGVERADQLVRLAGLGCDLYQGFLFSPPVDRQAVPPLLRIGG